MDDVGAHAPDEAYEAGELARAAGVEHHRVERGAGGLQIVGDVPAGLQEGDMELEAVVAVGRGHVGERRLSAAADEAVDDVEDAHRQTLVRRTRASSSRRLRWRSMTWRRASTATRPSRWARV